MVCDDPILRACARAGWARGCEMRRRVACGSGESLGVPRRGFARVWRWVEARLRDIDEVRRGDVCVSVCGIAFKGHAS